MDQDPPFHMTTRHCRILGVLIFFQLLTFSLITASVFSPIWGTIQDNEFGLYQCHSPCSKSNYRDQRSMVCNQADLASDLGFAEDASLLQSACKMFKGLERGQYAYVYCAAASVFLAGLCTMYVLSLIGKDRTVLYAVLLGALSLVFQLAGVIAWIVESNSIFAGCGDLPTDGSQPQICAGAGIGVAIAGLLGSAATNGLLVRLVTGLKRAAVREPRTGIQRLTKKGTAIGEEEMGNVKSEGD